ncbi:MAG: hypothetical protein F6K11_33735 [Leptolyngbya sp. SIO3F4]|nr:hypothetical protein [Leptolyngbya sp. SIO3F4]
MTLILFNCSKPENGITNPIIGFNSSQVVNDLSYNEALALIGTDKLSRGVEKPNPDGSLGRNKQGYFHVRFQINMTSISDYAIVSENLEALKFFLTTIQYSFNHQLEDGSFELEIPSSLLNSPAYKPPQAGDLVSGTAFFASSLGLSLLSLENSDWFVESEETKAIRASIHQLNPSFERTLDYLIANKEILMQIDAHAPNRLLFNALAFYSLGKYLSRTDAIDLAKQFIDTALTQTESESGYFIEGGGWDSSYNGVAIKLAMELYLLADEAEIKAKLKERFVPASAWQISRINNNGEISTDGNTRVFKGGEAFLGKEKGVDYVKTVRALLYFGLLTEDQETLELADSVLGFYSG